MKQYLIAALALAAAPAFSQSLVTVSPIDPKGWVFFDDLAAGPCLAGNACAFVAGPAAPTLGAGSAQLALSNSSDRPSLGARVDALAGLPLSRITALSYATFVAQNTDVQAIALQFPVDNDVTDADYGFKGRLVFEPYQEVSLGPVIKGQWQTWNTLNGRWWLSSAGNPARFPSSVCSQSAPCTRAELLGYYPNIGVRDVPAEPNVIFKAGSGWTGFNGNVDALVVGIDGSTTTFDFELGPTSKEACADGGWVGFFKNQGQCVSHFTSK